MLAIDRLTSVAQLESLKSRWIELHAEDERAHFFTSWDWLHACLTTESNPWMVLAVRDGDGPYIALLPLGDGRFPTFGPALNRELYLAGIPRADFTGVLIAKGEEHRVIPALARYIETLPWDNFTLNDWPDDRIAALIAEFPEMKYRAKKADPSPCPFIELPASWEAYLDTRTKHFRRTVRSKMRKLEAQPGFHFVVATQEESDAAIDRLLELNAARWNKSRRKRNRTFRELFRRLHASGNFILGSIKIDDLTIATQGSFVEPRTKTMLGYMMAYDAAYSDLSPGSMLVALSIRYAIENGFACYDLSRGSESYKQSLASDTRYSNHVTLTRRTLRVAAVNAGRTSYFAAKAIARNILKPSA
ncbi:MAG TPA: GNAT family N-acetyltransferase [Candidatus Tumulicola sp.]|jgi:CelD/BcsL family acetyltransferase involved in cellulose biosynthesis